jgi:RNA 3'-terminal phosphate cyclase (ATP)
MLLLQTALPILLFTQNHNNLALETNLTLKGGTNAEQAPQVDYTQNVFIPFLRKHFLGSEDATNENSCGDGETSASVEMKLERRGYFPKGGGVVHVLVKPLPAGKALRPIVLRNRGRVISIRGAAHYADLPTSIGTGMVRGALERLKAAGIVTDDVGGARIVNDINTVDVHSVHFEHRREPKATTTGAGSGIVLWAELEGGGIIGGSAIGRKGIDPKHIGAQAADELVKSLNNGGCIDEASTTCHGPQRLIPRAYLTQ